jgi:hypothetical protein
LLCQFQEQEASVSRQSIIKHQQKKKMSGKEDTIPEWVPMEQAQDPPQAQTHQQGASMVSSDGRALCGDDQIQDSVVGHVVGDLKQQEGADGDGDEMVVIPNMVDIEAEVAKTYGVSRGDDDEAKICGVFKSEVQLYVAICVSLILALAAVLMGVLIPPALARSGDGNSNGDGDGATVDPAAVCNGSQGCIPDATTLGQCLGAIGTSNAGETAIFTMCTGTHVLKDGPLQVQTDVTSNNESGDTTSMIRVACEKPSVYQQGSPCILQAPADQPVFVAVSNLGPVHVSNVPGDVTNPNFDIGGGNGITNVNSATLLVSFVDMTFTRPDIANNTNTNGEFANGAFHAPNATLTFLACSFLVSASQVPPYFICPARGDTHEHEHFVHGLTRMA